ncbi:hypothetical protein EV385_2879 [Krasilnikovia cinnamomea]|uniref:Uncharacterized protein n=1 Tax=Krasilnikovia cinnamomea TaxID=349313 RepID=A0A4Q7ZJL1_9ACTN|nr:hypothetical protein [Krasilnikovia cinnamomea]RZU51080.1 hypothetical protein EV385_2879 [Krasilnikovia cinnamomea]
MMDLMPAGEQPSVVEFGHDDESGPERPRRRLADWAGGLAADRRLVPLAAALGGVALGASLISEWQVTAVDATVFGDGQVGTKPLSATVADLGAWGGGYLVGLFPLVTAVVLVLFGPRTGRRYARLVGLSTAGVLLALLAAATAHLRHASGVLGSVFTVQLGDDQLKLTYGRGIWCALFGVAAVMLALYLAGRHLEPGAEREPADGADEAAAPTVWSWRRPRDTDDEGPPEAPYGLTVTSAQPLPPESAERDESA